MDFNQVILVLSKLLSKKRPESFNSSWILKQAPDCYRFIRKNIRTETGGIDWDKVTNALEWKYQRRWAPRRRRRKRPPYENVEEVDLVLNKYRDKLYVFIAPADEYDRRIREIISITLVRVAQNGNFLAKQQVMQLVGYTIDDWIDGHLFLSRWREYSDKLRGQLEGCIRRYRYTGSFIRYVFRTLEYAARGLRPLHAYSLDEPLLGGKGRKIDTIPCSCCLGSYPSATARRPAWKR